MRWIVFSFLMWLAPTASEAATSQVQSCINYLNNTGTAITCTFGATVTAGNVVACFAVQEATSTNTITYSDTASNTYTNRTYLTDTATPARGMATYSKTATGGFTVVTATWSGSINSRRYMVCHEIGGTAASPDDGYAGQFQLDLTSTSTDAITSTAITTTANGAYIFSASVESSGNCLTVTAGTGFTAGTLSGCNPRDEYLIQGVAGSQAGTFTKANVSATEWLTVVQAFKEDTGGGGEGPITVQVVKFGEAA